MNTHNPAVHRTLRDKAAQRRLMGNHSEFDDEPQK
jgi:hypothetical protein